MLSNQATDKLNTDKFNFPVDLLNIKTDTISGTNNTYKELRIPKNIGRAVIRKDTDEAIAIVGKDYHLVPHQDLFEEVTHQREMSDRSFDDIEVIDSIYNKGAIVKRTIVCRDDKYKVAIPTKKQDDYQHLRLDVYNSYDMSMGFHFVIGGYGHYCSNLQVFQGKAFLKSTICKSSQHNAEKVNIKRLNMFTHLYNEEAKRWGYTLWSLYNALTHWATHDVDNKARTPKYQINRQVELRNKVFKSNSWNNLVAVA